MRYRDFAHLVTRGAIERSDPLPPEVADDDQLAYPRLVLRFNRAHPGGLRRLIDAINELPSAPPDSAPPLDDEKSPAT